MADPLSGSRSRIDAIDRQLLDLLAERGILVDEVLATKQREGLSIFDPAREQQKVNAFRVAAADRGLDQDWSEDFLRMVMSASRAMQSVGPQPSATAEPRCVLLVGGAGKMGTLYARLLTRSGHEVRILDRGDWPRAGELTAGLDAAIVMVPIRDTEQVIGELAPHLAAETVLCDFTSQKTGPLEAMLAAHPGPVLGLHPMHGPDVQNLTKQLLIVCPGRDADQGAWLLEQARLWGMRLSEIPAPQHDRTMNLIQGLRHFLALLHGSFLAECQLPPGEILRMSSPIYRAELMMTGRIFAQNAELYADIVFADDDRRQLLLDFLDHHTQLAELVRTDNKDGFIAVFAEVRDFFGDFADQALTESSYLIHRLADRFA